LDRSGQVGERARTVVPLTTPLTRTREAEQYILDDAVWIAIIFAHLHCWVLQCLVLRHANLPVYPTSAIGPDSPRIDARLYFCLSHTHARVCGRRQNGLRHEIRCSPYSTAVSIQIFLWPKIHGSKYKGSPERMIQEEGTLLS